MCFICWGKTKHKNGKKCTTSRNYRSSIVHFNIANNDYHQDSGVLSYFVPNKPFGSLLDISPIKFYLFEFTDVWFTDQMVKH